jgi:hypothetical protein
VDAYEADVQRMGSAVDQNVHLRGIAWNIPQIDHAAGGDSGDHCSHAAVKDSGAQPMDLC